MFVPCIVGKRRFTRLLSTIKDDEEIATVSDEALALLGIENGCLTWDKIFENSNGEIRHMQKGETFPEDWMVDVPLPEYTRTARDDPTTSRTTYDKNWSDTGIKRFNKLRQFVIEDRKAHPEFKYKWLKLMRETKLKDKPIHNESDDSVLDADDDLFVNVKQNTVAEHAKTTAGVDSGSESDNDSDIESHPI